MLLPIEIDQAERLFAKFSDGMALASSDDIIIRCVTLDNRIHRFGIVASEAKVALDVEAAELQFAVADDRPSALVLFWRLRQSKVQGGDCMGDLLRHE